MSSIDKYWSIDIFTLEQKPPIS